MSDQEQAGPAAESEWQTVEMADEELDAVAAGLGATRLPAVQRPGAQASAPVQPGQQQGIIAILIG